MAKAALLNERTPKTMPNGPMSNSATLVGSFRNATCSMPRLRAVSPKPELLHRSIAINAGLCDSGSMAQDRIGSAAIAVFNRGPMDVQEQPTEGDTVELCVAMSDGQQHRYRRTEELQPLPDGRVAVVFDWAGRYYGPK